MQNVNHEAPNTPEAATVRAAMLAGTAFVPTHLLPTAAVGETSEDARTYLVVERVFRPGSAPWFEGQFCGWHATEGSLQEAEEQAGALAAELRTRYPSQEIRINRTTSR